LRWLKHQREGTQRSTGTKCQGADIAPICAGIARPFAARGILARLAEPCLRDYVARHALVPVWFLLIMASASAFARFN